MPRICVISDTVSDKLGKLCLRTLWATLKLAHSKHIACMLMLPVSPISFEPGKAFIRHLHKNQTIIEAIFWTSCRTCFSKFYQHPSASSISHLEMSWASQVASRTLAAPPKCRSYCRQQWPARASAPHGTLWHSYCQPTMAQNMKGGHHDRHGQPHPAREGDREMGLQANKPDPLNEMV